VHAFLLTDKDGEARWPAARRPPRWKLQAVPIFPGQEATVRYRVPEHLKPYPRTHAVITFAEPVFGPMAIGSGRHAGLGVMATVE
jgi:CRISPR-associated protein Csb2